MMVILCAYRLRRDLAQMDTTIFEIRARPKGYCRNRTILSAKVSILLELKGHIFFHRLFIDL